MNAVFKTVAVVFLFLISFTSLESENYIKNKSVNNPPPKIGDLAPDINLPSVNRTTRYKLSDLRGKIVLLNFWASLAAPCRFENPNLVKTYKQFKDKSFKNAQGFTIYSVSLDSNVENWKNAIAKD
ncbi:MAG: TlpA family protein disulfide reductase [Bacteroidales bacterium]|nr:TlpA family protein disulfide reductase [Bacteroidales bacterium]